MPVPVPLSLYVHFPWCVRKCPYCDFNSHAVRGEIPETDYIAALIRDLDFELRKHESRPLFSIFLGGGTPSLFSGKAVGCLLDACAKRLRFAPDIEITLEANPGTADAGNFCNYRAAGVNRLSIGVQSFNEKHLKALGRIHGPEDARRAVDLARRAGFTNINLDLMFALPEQTLSEAERDVRAACALAPEHLSYYHLTLEPHTEFHAHPPCLPDADLAWTLQEHGERILADHGYGQYEVSAYARTDRRCRHNLNYWEFGDYLGIGAGAHGKRTDTGGIERRARQRHPQRFLEHAGTPAGLQESRIVASAELPFEFCMNALRLRAGFRVAEFEQRTGLPGSVLHPALNNAHRHGLLEEDESRVRASALGWRHLNTLLTLFLPADVPPSAHADYGVKAAGQR
ncbi:MAG: radical SAM family heme chaperone HemW [Nevskiales bacterium]|nr:radical SAM family heme chaperone HemW [Nevskiales bacterium]